ncbi:MAG: hypothetical protein ACF8GE_10960 [Phycisphaerales bacterium JB043]
MGQQKHSDDAHEPDSVVDRRSGLDRRDFESDTKISGLERRRGPGRRRSDFARSAEEGELTPEQFLFVAAIDAFKQANNKTFPAWTDVLEVIRLLGYRKTQPSELGLRNLEDWLEEPDSPANVRTISAYEDNADDLAA